MRTVIVSAITFAFLPSLAPAHALDVAYKIDGAKVDIEAYYDDDSAAHKAKVTVFNEKNEELANGVTDKDGKWSFKTPAPGKYRIHVNAGAGHRANKMFTVPGVIADRGATPSIAVEQRTEESREELTRTPWLKIGIGLAAIAVGSAAFVFALRRPSAR